MCRVDMIFISLLVLLLVISNVESYNNFKSRIRQQQKVKTSPHFPPRKLLLLSKSTTSDDIPINSETSAAAPSEPQGSGIAAYYQEVLSLLAKVPCEKFVLF